MNNIRQNTPTIPIKQIPSKKFIPLVVGTPDSDLKIPAKLFEEQKIQNFIQDVLAHFENIKDKNASLYAIRLCKTNQYINEKNRTELLSLTSSTKFHDVDLCLNLETEVKCSIEKISGSRITNADSLISHLISVEKYISADKIFALEFYAKGGRKIIIDFIQECEKSSDSKKWSMLYHLYKIFILFIKNWSLFTWETSETELNLLKSTCEILNESTKDSKKEIIPDFLVLLYLQNLNYVMLNCISARELILKEIKFHDILFLIQRSEIQIKEALLIFLNSCFLKGDTNFRKNLNSILSQPLANSLLREELRVVTNLDNEKANRDSQSYSNMEQSNSKIGHFRNMFNEQSKKLKDKIRKRTQDHDSEILIASLSENNFERIFKNFALLQKNILDIEFSIRIRTPVDKVHFTRIEEICKMVFDPSLVNSTEKTLTDDEKLSRLGFMNIKNPIHDFDQTPPGILALDFLEYFTKNKIFKSVVQNFVNERSVKNLEYMFPFAKASIYMIQHLIEILKIGKNEIDQKTEILFILFIISPDGIFDFFGKILWLFYRLWIEMKAQSLDFERALNALKDSLHIILTDLNKVEKSNGQGYSSIIKKKLSDLNNLVDTWKYDLIKKGKSRYDKSGLEPIKELELILTNEVIENLRPKRLKALCKGETFEKSNLKDKKTKQKQFWSLSPDYKTFNISEFENLQSTEVKTATQIEVEFIKDIKKDEPRKQMFSFQIVCLRMDEIGEETIILSNQSETIIDAWFDGLSILINPKPTTSITCFVECLIDVRLLDINTLGIEIPQKIPEIPTLPADFDFNIKDE